MVPVLTYFKTRFLCTTRKTVLLKTVRAAEQQGILLGQKAYTSLFRGDVDGKNFTIV